MNNMNAREWHGLGVEDIMDLTLQQVTALARESRKLIINPASDEDRTFNDKQKALTKECTAALNLKNTTRPDVDPKSLIKRRK